MEKSFVLVKIVPKMKIALIIASLVLSLGSCGPKEYHENKDDVLFVYNILDCQDVDRPIYCFYYDSCFHYRNNEYGFCIDSNACLVDTIQLGNLGKIIPLNITHLDEINVETIRCGVMYESHSIPDFVITIDDMKTCTVTNNLFDNNDDVYSFELTKSERKLLQYVIKQINSQPTIDMTKDQWKSESKYSVLFEGSYLFIATSRQGLSEENFLCLWADSISTAYYMFSDAVGAIVNNHLHDRHIIQATESARLTQKLFESKLLEVWNEKLCLVLKQVDLSNVQSPHNTK